MGKHNMAMCHIPQGQIAIRPRIQNLSNLCLMPKRAQQPAADPATSEMQRLVGARIKAIRKLGQIKQKAVCALLGVDQSTWSKWEAGSRAQDAFVLARFAARARTTMDFIYRGQLEGTHPALQRLLRESAPHLLAPAPTGTGPDKDTDLTSYKSAIQFQREG